MFICYARVNKKGYICFSVLLSKAYSVFFSDGKCSVWSCLLSVPDLSMIKDIAFHIKCVTFWDSRPPSYATIFVNTVGDLVNSGIGPLDLTNFARPCTCEMRREMWNAVSLMINKAGALRRQFHTEHSPFIIQHNHYTPLHHYYRCYNTSLFI